MNIYPPKVSALVLFKAILVAINFSDFVILKETNWKFASKHKTPEGMLSIKIDVPFEFRAR